MYPGCDNGKDDYDLDVDVDAGGGGWQGWLWIFPRRRSIPSNEGSRPFRPIYQSPPLHLCCIDSGIISVRLFASKSEKPNI